MVQTDTMADMSRNLQYIYESSGWQPLVDSRINFFLSDVSVFNRLKELNTGLELKSEDI